MTTLFSSPLASSAHDPVSLSIPLALSTRVLDLMNDVEREIELYISDQRARDQLRSSPEPEPRKVRHDQAPSSPSRFPNYHPHQPQLSPLFIKSRNLHRRAASHNTILDAIFDTPECRTQLSPVATSPCQLRRRGATFHRVEQAVVEASERRIKQWHLEGLTIPPHRDQPPSLMNTPDDVKPPSSLHRSPSASPETEGAKTIVPPSEDGGEASQPSDEPGLDLVSVPQPSSSRLKDADQSSQYTSSSLSDSSSVSSLCPPLCPSGASTSVEFPSCNTSPSNNSEPRFYASIDGDRPIALAPPATSAIRSHSVPALGLHHDTNASSAELHEEDNVHANTITQSHRKLLGRLSQKAIWSVPHHQNGANWTMAPVKRMKSVSRRARIQVNRRNKLAAAKAKAVGESVTDVLRGRAFHRLEVQELIDTGSLSTSALSHYSDSSHSLVEVARDPSRVSADGNDPTTSDFEVRPDHDPRAFAFPKRNKNPPRLQIDPSNDLSLSAEYEEALLDIAHGSNSQGLPISSRSSPGPLTDADREALSTSRLPVIGGRSDDRTKALPLPASRHRPGGSASSMNDLLQPEAAVSSVSLRKKQRDDNYMDDVDLTAFQMAISGPTGDYLMSGDTFEETGSNDDEIVDWFLTFGFQSEGGLVQTHETEQLAHPATKTDWRHSLVELPASTSFPARERKRTGVRRRRT